MADNAKIHTERAGLADTLSELSPEQWSVASLCAGWSVKLAAAHVLSGAEQTGPRFMGGMAATGFRFNARMKRDANRLGALSTTEIVDRLRARTSTTNHPPAPVMAMLGEVVVHGEDIRRPLGLHRDVPAAAVVACLEMFKGASFPVAAKRRIERLQLVATDSDWKYGAGPEVRGPGLSLVLAMTGRQPGLEDLAGDGLATLRSRLAT
ncbi:MAG: maleylpyruvate isomerase family mycothiol-dependent enzyme [Acidimicrobiales bacterium]